MEHLPHEAVSEIISALVWLFVITGTALMLIVSWIARSGITYVGKELKGIREELRETNAVLGKIDNDLRGELVALDRRKTEEISGLERRVALVEVRCTMQHGDRQ